MKNARSCGHHYSGAAKWWATTAICCPFLPRRAFFLVTSSHRRRHRRYCCCLTISIAAVTRQCRLYMRRCLQLAIQFPTLFDWIFSSPSHTIAAGQQQAKSEILIVQWTDPLINSIRWFFMTPGLCYWRHCAPSWKFSTEISISDTWKRWRWDVMWCDTICLVVSSSVTVTALRHSFAIILLPCLWQSVDGIQSRGHAMASGKSNF